MPKYKFLGIVQRSRDSVLLYWWREFSPAFFLIVLFRERVQDLCSDSPKLRVILSNQFVTRMAESLEDPVKGIIPLRGTAKPPLTGYAILLPFPEHLNIMNFFFDNKIGYPVYSGNQNIIKNFRRTEIPVFFSRIS